MTDRIEVKTADLKFGALDWCIARVEGIEVELTPPNYGDGTSLVFIKGAEPLYRPSTNWEQGGPLIEKYKVSISPPTSPVHRNFGYMDKRNGYAEAGVWGSTIFGKERKYRRTAFHHPDSPLVAAMLAIVQSELGDTIQVPKELMP